MGTPAGTPPNAPESLGYAGCSYLALTGWVVADILPPKVKTMYLTHYGVFRHTSAYQDGLFRHDISSAGPRPRPRFYLSGPPAQS